jgi:serine/threonine-protein kinase
MAPTSALAQTAQEKAIAEELFNAAKKAYDAGNYGEACTKFGDSQKLDPGIGTALYLGGCLEKQGRIASARQSFLDASILAQKLGDTKRGIVAKARADALVPTTLKIAIEKPTAGLEVKRDGGLAMANVADPVDGGMHEITATAPGYQPFSRTVEVPKEKGTVVVSLDLVPIATKPNVIPPAPPIVVRPPDGEPEPEPRPTSSGSGMKIAGIAIGAAGMAGVVVGAITGAKSLADLDASNDPQQGQCDPHSQSCLRQRGVDLRASANMFAAVSTVSFIAGGVLVATGVTIFILAPSSKVKVSAGPSGFMLSGAF